MSKKSSRSPYVVVAAALLVLAALLAIILLVTGDPAPEKAISVTPEDVARAASGDQDSQTAAALKDQQEREEETRQAAEELGLTQEAFDEALATGGVLPAQDAQGNPIDPSSTSDSGLTTEVVSPLATMSEADIQKANEQLVGDCRVASDKFLFSLESAPAGSDGIKVVEDGFKTVEKWCGDEAIVLLSEIKELWLTDQSNPAYENVPPTTQPLPADAPVSGPDEPLKGGS